MDNYKWDAYVDIELVDCECNPFTIHEHFVMDEYEDQFSVYMKAVTKARSLINTKHPGCWISKIELA